ncbi:MAG: ammonium transporter [Sulfuricurvum sp.]|uniref:ammonium transporter n=1 Tax=Sulfuricurvum sp. TaxID=2025608 RepID=UPI00261F1671|nr:ammonium transporter [Sulfuricurvum sp.]MDD2368576.1 ammonium transporter [Sulfuricurvum sp.]MDD2949444.1 ammonium transporter [Sulfuricurvum sp.]MDD5117449.1 ammonium transporter [Sulfuricurvum sp.]
MDTAYVIDTLFTLFSITLIILMVPGFAMLEAGLVRTKNVSSVLTVNVMIYAVASMAFILIGFHLAFGDAETTTMSKWAFFMFQMAFVGKAINIMSGGVGERARLLPLTLFTVIMGALIYPTAVNISWGSDWLKDTLFDINMVDLAGSTVIHSTGGWALLAAILVIGSRKGRYVGDQMRVIPASNIPLVVLGAMLLWIGWFGFNGGSVGSIATKEAADSVALTIFNTNVAGLAGAISAGIMIYARYKLFDITMILNGALGGLVAVTAGAHLFTLYDALAVGFIGGLLVVLAIPLFDKVRIDDPVGALSVHLVNGIWGTLAVGIFASNAVKNITFMNQLKGVAEIAIFVFTVSFVIIYLINKVFPFRATDEEQQQGLDVSECGLEAYPEFKRAI